MADLPPSIVPLLKLESTERWPREQVAERLKELRIQKDSLQEEISYYEKLNAQNQPVYITRSMIESYRKEMEEVFVGSNVHEQRDFLKKFIEKIIIHDGGIEIVYYAPGPRSLFSKTLGV